MIVCLDKLQLRGCVVICIRICDCVCVLGQLHLCSVFVCVHGVVHSRRLYTVLVVHKKRLYTVRVVRSRT